MGLHIALLRGVNVGGNQMVAMWAAKPISSTPTASAAPV